VTWVNGEVSRRIVLTFSSVMRTKPPVSIAVGEVEGGLTVSGMPDDELPAHPS